MTNFPMILSLWLAGCIAFALSAEEFDLGGFPANTPQSHVFTIQNTGTTPLTLGRIRSSCGCTVPTLSRNVLQPQEMADLQIELKPNTLSGTFVQTVYVETDDPRQRFLKFTLKGTARPLYRVLPAPILYVGTLTAGEAGEFMFRIAFDDGPVEFAPPEYDHSIIETAELQYEDAAARLKVRIRPQLPAQSFQLRIVLPVKTPGGWPALEVMIGGKTVRPQSSKCTGLTSESSVSTENNNNRKNEGE